MLELARRCRAVGDGIQLSAAVARVVTAISAFAMLVGYPVNVQAGAPTFAALDADFNNGQPLELSGGQILFSSPTLADLTGDGKLEILAGGDDGNLHAIRHDGTILWTYQVANAINPYVAQPTATSVIRGAPSVGDLDGDGDMEIVIGVGTTGSAQLYDRPDVNGALVVLDHTGQLVDGWPFLPHDQVGNDFDGYTDAVAASPALGDLDGDGTLEIVASSFDMRIYAWHHDGTPVVGWPKFVRDTVWSPVGLADLNDDGALEVVVLVPTHVEPAFDTIDGGELRIYEGDGRLLCKHQIDQGFVSAPAIGDIDGDGALEIVTGTGDWYEGVGRGWEVYVFDGRCNPRPGWPQPTQGYMRSAPALADLDSDGNLEIIATSGTINWGTLDRRIYAWHADGSFVRGFPMVPRDFFDTSSYPLSPIVADWDGDGVPEIFTSLAWEVAGVDANGRQFTYYGWPDGPSGQKTLWGNYQLSNDPAIGDIDGDSHLELVIASVATEGDPARGGILVYESPAPARSTPWPMLGANAQHTHEYTYGVHKQFDAQVINHTIPKVMIPGTAYQVEITVENIGTESWSVADPYRLVLSDPSVFGLQNPPDRTMLTAQVSSGETETLGFAVQAPATPGYYFTEWRMTNGKHQFGRPLQMEIKVGNDPAIYVLATDTSQNSDGTSIYRAGLAKSIPAPRDAESYPWSDVIDFGISRNAFGYHVISSAGSTTRSEGETALGFLPHDASRPWRSLAMLPDGTGFYGLDINGRVHRTDGAEPLTFTGISAVQMQDIAVTPDGRGALALDRQGNVYRAGTAPSIKLPAALPFPPETAIARKLNVTADGKGYYILDDYGRVYAAGSAQPLSPNYDPHTGEDWARDFALTEAGRGYYLLDKYGGIHTGGDAPPLSTNFPPRWTNGEAVAIEVVDTRTADGPQLLPSTTSVSLIMADDDDDRTWSVYLTSDGSDRLAWTASLSPQVSWLALSQWTGTTPSDLMLTIYGSLPQGTYETTLLLEARDASGEVVHTSDIPVKLHVWDDINAIFLPMTVNR